MAGRRRLSLKEWGFLTLCCLMLACTACASRVVSAPDTQVTTLVASQLRGSTVDLHTQRPITFEMLVSMVSAVQVVAVGEEHYQEPIQTFALRLLQALAQRRPQRLALAMEFLEHDMQPVVDEYLQGAIDRTAFQKRISASANFMRFYFPLVQAAKDHGLPVLAINVPRRLARQIAQQGLQTTLQRLSPDDLAYLPPSLSTITPEYRTYFLDAVAAHHPVTGEQAERFVEASHVKDDTMAATIARFLDDHSGFTVFVLAGRFHIDYGRALPRLLQQRRHLTTIQRITTMSLDDGDTVDVPHLSQENIADYVWFAPQTPPTEGNTPRG